MEASNCGQEGTTNGVEMGSSSQGNIGMGAGGGCDAGLGGMSLGLVGIFMAARKGKKQ